MESAPASGECDFSLAPESQRVPPHRGGSAVPSEFGDSSRKYLTKAASKAVYRPLRHGSQRWHKGCSVELSALADFTRMHASEFLVDNRVRCWIA